ncbi:MAG: ATP-binding protein [Nitrospirae bacterium]|nr:ATP-binding protein [Nitrospirota bacterium]
MGIIDERRRLISGEMEAGRGSPEVHARPVSLEPPYKPFSLRPEKRSLFDGLFGRVQDAAPIMSKHSDNTSRFSFIHIKPSREDKNSPEIAEQLILSLPAINPISFEIVGYEGKIIFQAAVEESLADSLIHQISAHIPGADLYSEEDLLKKAVLNHATARAYRLKSSHFFSMEPATECDPYRTLFGCIGNLKQGQLAVVQILITPVSQDWQGNMRKASRNLFDPAQSPFVDLPQLPKLVDKKLLKPLFAVSLRLIASDEALLKTMEGFLKQFDSIDNGIIPISGAYPIQSIMARDTRVHGAILNSTELSYFMHLPAPELIESMPCIERAAKSYPVPNEFTTDGPILGVNTHRGVRRTVRHSPSLPNRHVYVTGKSGYGKSNLILYSAIQRIERGDGVGIIDPHGSLIREGILPCIPKERIVDVVYLNAGDFEHPMAINPLAHSGTKLEKEHIRVDLLNFFEDLFEASLGVNIQHSLNFFIVSLLTRRDSTLSDIERLLLDKDWRNALVQGIDDDRVRMFWEHEYPQLEKRGIVTAITNKLSPLILPDSAIAPMLKQRENRLDFLKVMDRKMIFLCNLSHGDIGKRNSQLLGKLLVSKLQIAAMMREGNGTSPDFYLYIDEFQHMVCPSMADILSGARKYGLHLWLTNQMTGDIPDSILRHVFNASTLIFFASDSPNDQTLIEKNLSKRFKAEDIGQLKRGEAFVKMLGNAFNMITERVAETPVVNNVDEIIAASRKRYTVAETDQTNTDDKRCRGSFKLLRGTGSRLAKFVLITPKGFDALNIDIGVNTGKGGSMHRYWQSVIKSYAETKGYVGMLEEPVAGGKETVDVGLQKNGQRLAIEISITTRVKHEVGNVKKCLDAGYDHVLSLFLDEGKLSEFEALSEQEMTVQERLRLSSGLLTGFWRLL